MEVSNINNTKVYSLNNAKSIPEWLNERKRRKLLKRDSELRNRIEFLQDFEMPAYCNKLKLTEDGQYLFATGGYKPRVRCYDTNMLSMKFERCFDSSVINFEILSDDYKKLVFMLDDRYVEFHSQGGRYYRLRIPKFGHDFAYHKLTCDLYFVCNSNEIIRLNLEQGKFVTPLVSEASSYNVCKINPEHHLFFAGSNVGTVECWDYRSPDKLGKLDCAFTLNEQGYDLEKIPEITSLAFYNDVYTAVGTCTGQILLYDIRSNKPYLVKDQMYGLPIKSIEFHKSQDLVFTQDAKILKLWNRHNGKPFVFIQSKHDYTDLCLAPDSGLFFMSAEDKKMLTYYIPELGPAPKWCSFLDRMVEELEEQKDHPLFDDYKFVTLRELEDLGLNHLIGSNLLRAYMHGFFMDIKLYNKAKAAVDPFAFETYKKQKIQEQLEQKRKDRVILESDLPKVNRKLAEKIMENNDEKMFEDDRFKEMFENPDFEIDYDKVEPTASTSKRQDQRNKHKAKYISRNYGKS